MAPMLGRKLFSLSRPLIEPLIPGEKTYTIQHSKETFRSKEKYEARLSIYRQRIWTCKSTGSSQLTHKEAWDLEQTISEHLKAKFPSWFEKPVLQIIHHSTLALEQLVDQAYLEIMTKYALDEECDFEYENGKYTQVKIAQVYPLEETDPGYLEKNTESTWDFPSNCKVKSDLVVLDCDIKDPLLKENGDSIAILRKRLGFEALPPFIPKKEKKQVPPKFLPHKYKVMVQNKGKIISRVPTERLRRTECPPSIVTVRYFIRHHALQIGMEVNAPWVVEDELVKKYALSSKFRDFISDPYKHMTLNYSTNKRNKCLPTEKNPSLKTENGDKPIEDKTQKISHNGRMSVKPKSSKEEFKDPKVEKITLEYMISHSTNMSKTLNNITVSLKPFSNPQKDVSPVALHLVAYYRINKDRENQKDSLSCLITEAVQLLTNDDHATLPEDLQFLVKKRHKKLKHMSEKQCKQYLRETRNMLKEKLKEKAKQRREKKIQKKLEEQQLFLDEHLSGDNLPTFKLVDTPERLPNMLFGDVVRVVEFLNCYSGLLMPYGKFPVSTVSLMEALTAGKSGFIYVNLVLMALLHTLLNDKISQNYTDLGMKMSEIPVSLHSVSELVRLCLHNAREDKRSKDSFQEDNAAKSDDSSGFTNKVKDEILQKLETSEFFELVVEEKIHIMGALCHTVHNHLEALQQRSEKADIKKEHSIFLDAEDLIRDVKRRSQLVLQSAMEEEEEQGRLLADTLMEKLEEEGVQKPISEVEKALCGGFAKAKLVLHRSPIGIDRNHNMYWLFSNAVPGLFINKHSISDSKKYTSSLQPKKLLEKCDPDPENNMEIGGMASTLTTTASSVSTEVTPVLQQETNVWFFCDNQKELDELMDCLHPQGVRESELKECLQNRYQEIVNSINLADKPNPSLKHFDGQQELQNFLRISITEMAMRLHESGLSHPDKTTKFEARVNSLHHLKDFGDCVILLQACVRKKYLQGLMAPKQKNPLSDSSHAKTEHVDEKRMTEEAKVETTVEKWKCAVRNAQTFSRMHLLLGMLDACIKWDMSSQKLRCKVCFKKIEDDQLILCDQCDEAFHLFCLRPALCELPDGEWQCPACQPSTPRCNANGMNYAYDFTDEEDANDENPSEEDYEEGDIYFSEEEELRFRSRTAAKAKHRRSARTENQDQPVAKKSKMGACELQKCEEILNKLINYRFSWPFREPIIPEGSQANMETDINPMDFITMLSKCTCNMYNTAEEFLADIKLVFSNAERYNRRGSYVTTCLQKTENFLVAMLKEQLPSHAYQCIKPRKRPAKRAAPRTDEEAEEVSDPEMVKHCIGVKRKK